MGCAVLIGLPALASASPSAPHRTPASSAKPSGAKPTIASVQRHLGELAVKNSQLVEQFDTARVQVGKRMKAADAATRIARKAAQTYNAANVAFTQVVQAQYETGGFGGASSALLTSNSDGNYLDRISTMDLVSSHEADVVTDVRKAGRIASSTSRTAHQLLLKAQVDRKAVAAKRDKVQAEIKKYKTLLAKLNSAQQAAYARALNPSVSQSTLNNIHVQAPTAAAKRAVQFALHQVGKPYVFGAAGPSSYDCSGLTMRAWAHGGISLPHSAAEQYNYGQHVNRDQLQPGDLIFFYQPIGHVTIYIGDGMMVSAPTEGEDVTVVPLDAYNSDYAGATHLG